MEIRPGIGIGDIIFGYKQPDITSLLGEPDKVIAYKDDDQNELIYLYNEQKVEVTFYKDQDHKLGYIRSANEALTYKGMPIIGQPIKVVLKNVFGDFGDWEFEDYGSFEVYNCDDNWVSLHVAYGVITDLELGVLFNDDDTYDWPKLLVP